MNWLKNIVNKIMIFGNKDFNLIYNKENNNLMINTNKNIEVNITGNFTIRVNGEVNIITENNTMGLDTINSQLYFNSRIGKVFDNDNEAKIYREMLQQQLKNFQESQIKKELESLKE